MKSILRFSSAAFYVALIVMIGQGQIQKPSNVNAARFALVLDKQNCGWIPSPRVGTPVTLKAASSPNDKLITLKIGGGMSSQIYEWISASFDRRHIRKDGAIHSCDYDGNIKSTLDFFHALISEIGFPALDASSKDSAAMTVVIAPEYTKYEKGDGSKVTASFPVNQKPWLPGNFRLELKGHDTSHVQKIDPLILRESAFQVPPLKGDPPELSFYVPEIDFQKGYPSRWLRLANDPVKDLSGRYIMFTNDGKPCWTLDFSAEAARAQKSGEGSIRVTFRMANLRLQFAK